MTLRGRIAVAGLTALALAWPAGAALYTSKSNGNYSVDSTWNEGGNPGVGAVADTVTINAPHMVTVTNKYTASNDVVIINPGAILRTPPGASLSMFLAGAQIELRGGTLATDVREWEGLQNGSKIVVVSNSIIDTIDSFVYPQTLGHTYFGSLVIQPSVTKLIFTNSWWNTSPFETASCAFNVFSLSNSVELCIETPKAYVEFNNLAIDSGKVLTKTGAGRLQVKGVPNIKGNIVVNEGSIEPLTPQCLGTNEVTINPGAVFSLPYMSGSSVGLLGLAIGLNGGKLDYGYTSWAQTLRGAIIIKSNATLNIYNNHSTLNGTYNTFDTLAFQEDPSGNGYELHCTHVGSHANWTNTVIGSKFGYPCAISNNAVINADKYAGLWFDKAVVLSTGKTLTKKGEGVLTFNGVVTNGGTLAVEEGTASVIGQLVVNNSSATLANNTTAAGLFTVSGGVRGVGDLVLNNNSAISTGISFVVSAVTNAGRIVNSGTGTGSVLISSVIGVPVTAVVQDSATSLLILSGANTYTGATTIASGATLRLANTAGSATGTGAVNVNPGATLEGNATMAGAVTSGGTVKPGLNGTAGGTLTMGNLTWNGGSAFHCEIASIANNEFGAGLDYDQIVVTNALTAVPNGSNLVIRMDSLGQTLAFEPNRNYSLRVIRCGTGATLNPADVTLDTNDFLVEGTWSVTNLNNSIYVVCLGASSPTRNYWRGTGNWSAATNWSLGHVPVSSEDVEFDFLGAANCTVDAVSNDLGSLTLAAGYTGTVTFLTRFPGQGTFTNVSIIGDCVLNGGALSHPSDAASETYRLCLRVGGDLTMGPGGQINVDNQGFGNTGPGWMGSYMAASHGGQGTGMGTTYGTITSPTNIGSGCSKGGGGGAVQLTVVGTSTVDGVISASDRLTTGYGSSGGSVFLTAGTLAGTGTIRANGRFGSGGGRVAVILTNSTDFGTVIIQALGGPGDSYDYGAAGTVYLQHKNHQPGKGKLIVDNKDYVTETYTFRPVAARNTTQNGRAASSYEFSEIVLTNGAVYALDTNDTLIITNTVIHADPTDRNEGIFVVGGTLVVPEAFGFTNYYIAVGATNSTFNPIASLTVGTNATLKFDVPWTVNYPVTLESGGWLSHSPNGSMESNRLNLTLNAGLDVQAGGMVNVDNMGFFLGGPGYVGYYKAASYGGQGTAYNPTYGSITTPTNCGSCSVAQPERGGGAARLAVAGTINVNGVISASDMGFNAYGSSGGSVFLTAGALTGNGTIRANGRAGAGGGRVAVILTNSTDFGSIAMQAYGGSGGGAAGTIYKETAAEGPGNGTLVINANNTVGIPTTLIGSNIAGTMVGSVVITNKARLSITNQTLTVQGSWENRATFLAMTGSTVRLAGTNAATVWSTNTFYNLTITNEGKIVSFEPGKTNRVAGLLQLGSTVQGSTVTLRSTEEGNWWYLSLAPGGTQQIARVRVTDGHAGGGPMLMAGKGSINGGHNFNWYFPKIGGTVILVR